MSNSTKAQADAFQLSPQQVIGLFVQRGENWNEFQEKKLALYKTNAALYGKTIDTTDLLDRYCMEDGGTSSLGVVIKVFEPSNACDTEGTDLADDYVITCIAVLWRHGSIGIYPYCISKFVTESLSDSTSIIDMFHVIEPCFLKDKQYEMTNKTIGQTNQTALFHQTFSFNPKQRMRDLFLMGATLHLLEKVIVPKAQYPQGTDVKVFLHSDFKSTQLYELVKLYASTPIMMCNTSMRQSWHEYINLFTPDFTKIKHVFQDQTKPNQDDFEFSFKHLAIAMLALLCSIESEKYSVFWSAYREQWIDALQNLFNPKQQQQHINRNNHQTTDWDVLPCSIRIASLCSTVMNYVTDSATSSAWYRDQIMKIPLPIKTATTTEILGNTFAQVVFDMDSHKEIIRKDCLEKLLHGVRFPWKLPTLNSNIILLRKALGELEAFIPPEGFIEEFHDRSDIVYNKIRNRFLAHLLNAHDYTKILQAIESLRDSLDIELAFMPEWIDYRYDAYMIQRAIVQHKLSLQTSKNSMQNDIEIAGEIATLLCGLASSLLHCSEWIDTWKPVFQEQFDAKDFIAIAPIKTLLSEELLVQSAASDAWKCAGSSCNHSFSSGISMDRFRTMSSHLVSMQTFTDREIATASDFDSMDISFCRDCVVRFLGIYVGDRVSRHSKFRQQTKNINDDDTNEQNIEIWPWSDQDQNTFGIVTHIHKDASLGWIEVHWDAQKQETFSYRYGIGNIFDVEKVHFEIHDHVKLMDNIGRIKAIYATFAQSKKQRDSLSRNSKNRNSTNSETPPNHSENDINHLSTMIGQGPPAATTFCSKLANTPSTSDLETLLQYKGVITGTLFPNPWRGTKYSYQGPPVAHVQFGNNSQSKHRLMWFPVGVLIPCDHNNRILDTVEEPQNASPSHAQSPQAYNTTNTNTSNNTDRASNRYMNQYNTQNEDVTELASPTHVDEPQHV